MRQACCASCSIDGGSRQPACCRSRWAWGLPLLTKCSLAAALGLGFGQARFGLGVGAQCTSRRGEGIIIPQHRGSSSVVANAPTLPPTLLPCPQQPLSSAQLRRNRDKLVALLEEGQYSLLEEAGAMGAPSPVPSPITQVGRL